MELDSDPNDLKQHLLSKERQGSGDEYQSCKSDDELVKANQNQANINVQKVDSSINHSNNGSSGNNNHNESLEENKEVANEGRNVANKPHELPPKARSFNAKSKKKEKPKAKSVLREILDFLYFCYEFLMLMAIIATSIPLPSIPSSIYVFLCLLYLATSILINSKNTSLTICTFVIGLQLAVSCLFLIFKIVISILISKGTVSGNGKLYKSLGVSVTQDEADGWEYVRTLASDVCSLVVSLLLMIGCLLRRSREDELNEKNIESLKVSGSRSPKFWSFVSIFVIGLAGIISPSLMSFLYVVCTAVGLYTWSLYFDLQGPIMNVITYTSLLISALFTCASFIVQIEYFESIRGSWVDYIGLDNFNSDNPNFDENLTGFIFTVFVYIINLIYLKATSRYKLKMSYLEKRYPERAIRISNSSKKEKPIRHEDTTLLETLVDQIKTIVINQYLHLLIFRFCCFIWIYLYFCFESLLPLTILCHSIIYVDEIVFINALKFLYMPLFWLIMMFNYIVNIQSLFDSSLYIKENYRYGIFYYNPAFPHLAFQLFTLFYGCFTIYLFRMNHDEEQRRKEHKERREKRLLSKKERLLSAVSKFTSSERSFIGEESEVGFKQGQIKSHTYEILLRYILKNIDITLMIVLYIAGVNRVDVYHMFLLCLFVVFIMYPDGFRKKFIYLLYFMIFIAAIKYLYILFLPEFLDNKQLNDIFNVLGFSTDYEDKKYGKSNLFNNNYLIVFTGFIQYRLYTSEYSKKAFTEEQAKEDIATLSKRYPRIISWMGVIVDLILFSIPWITYIIFIIIAVYPANVPCQNCDAPNQSNCCSEEGSATSPGTRSIINWVLLAMTLILVYLHISLDLVTSKGHAWLHRGWGLFTLLSALCFLAIITYQILCKDEISMSDWAQNIIANVPDYIKDNMSIIGLEDYTDYSAYQLGIKLIAYVAYFNLSVIVRRQVQRSSDNVAKYEAKEENDVRAENQESQNAQPMKSKFNLAFCVYKVKWGWFIIDFISWHIFLILSILIISLALHWKLSVSSLILLLIVILYIMYVSFSLQPSQDARRLGISNQIKLLEELWKKEDIVAKSKIIKAKKCATLMLAFVSIICILILHLSANLQFIKVNDVSHSNLWENIVFYAFLAGTDYNYQIDGNSYSYEIYGFLLVLLFCVLERKGEIWLENKFGFEGSVYDTYKGSIKLERYGSEVPRKISGGVSNQKALEVIDEDDEEEEKKEETKNEYHDLIPLNNKVNGSHSDKNDNNKNGENKEPNNIDQEFEDAKTKEIKRILSLEYRFCIAKALRYLTYVIVILIGLIAVVYKSDVWGFFILVISVISSFLGCSYRNIKWSVIILSCVFILEYCSALANLSYLNSPSVFPVPFDDKGVERPIDIPFYSSIGSPFTEKVPSGTDIGLLRPTKWAFYLGFIITSNRLNLLWLDFMMMLMLNYFTMYFYSITYELKINLDTEATIIKALQIQEEAEESAKQSVLHQSSRGDKSERSFRNSNKEESFYENVKANKNSEVKAALSSIDEVRKKMFIYQFYNGVCVGVSSTSSIVSLVCLLMIAFQIQGFINLIYICFCLYYIVRAVNFIYQRNWTFPNRLKKILKPLVVAEIFLQLLYQIPYDSLHNGETDPKGWQKIIGFMSLWSLDSKTNLPISINVSNLLLKCFMYAFILLQENIFASKEYHLFIASSLAQIRILSERKADAIAFLYNNFKITTTIKNQFEKEAMMRKLAQVNRQLRKWNRTVFKNASKGDGRKGRKFREKIKEVAEHLEEEKENPHEESKSDQPTMSVVVPVEEVKKEVNKYEGLKKADLIKILVEEKLGMAWKIWILGMKYATNQILLIFNQRKLDAILENIRDGETHIYTPVELCLFKDYENDMKKVEELELNSINDVPKEHQSKLTEKKTKGIMVIIAYLSLLFNIIVSNTSFICYVIMIVAHIMNGSLISLFYPFSIFIYALLEERRPRKTYWMVVIYYSAITLTLKFLMQTYPLSDWLTRNSTSSGDTTPQKSVNDTLKTVRLGLEVVDDGKNFLNYFLFEALILFTVTLHIFVQIFGGVWNSREIDRETIHQAAARITSIQKQRKLEKEAGRSIEHEDTLEMDSDFQRALSDILPPDYDKLRRKRSYSVNDCCRLREIAKDIEEREEESFDNYPEYLDEWSDIEDNFAYGGEKYEEKLYETSTKVLQQEMKSMTRKEFVSNLSKLQKEAAAEENIDLALGEESKINKQKGRSMSEYKYKTPEKSELIEFIIENKAGENRVKKFFMKISASLTHSKYFESLFPSIKQQKPGLDLYFPMALVQGLLIVFMIFFYTRMDPDYTNITSDTLTPNQLNQVMVLAIFLQIAVIVLDRYLYLSRDYVEIEEVDIDEDSDDEMEDISHSDSISQFTRQKTFDLRSSSGENLLVRGLGMDKKDKALSVKSKNQEKVQLEDLPEDGEEKKIDEKQVQLSKTSFNKTIVLKYYLQLFMLILVNVITFWYFPIKANTDLQITAYCDYSNPDTGKSCNEVFMNWTLVVFYLLYCAYFAISALQIRFGLPELRKGNFAMGDTGPINKGAFQGYLAAPFIVELKVVSDWTFTRTSLDLFQWLKFENIYADLFIAKCTNKGYLEHPLGEPMPGWKKMSFGCCGLLILIILIAGPLLLFSSFNPLADNNFVTGGNLRLLIRSNLTDGGAVEEYELFNTDRVSGLQPISDKYYDRIKGYRTIRNLQRDLFQQVIFSKVSDSSWSPSPPSQQEIYQRVLNSKDGDLPINIVMIYAFDRPQPAGQQRINKELPIINILAPDVSYRTQVKDALILALNPDAECDPTLDISFYMDKWLIPTIRLPQDIKPKLIKVTELSQKIYISKKCKIGAGGQVTNWWEVSQNVYTGDINPDPSVSEGVVFFTWSEKVTSNLIGYSLITFYIIVVLGIGRALRAVIQSGSEQIFIKDMPKPDQLLLICEGILISRIENNLEREEELYYILIDIMRSPEILKMITDSSLRKKGD